MDLAKKVLLSGCVITLAIFIYTRPTDSIQKVLPFEHQTERFSDFDTDREGEIVFNGETLKYRRHIVNDSLVSVLREFKANGQSLSKGGVKMRKIKDKVFAWYTDQNKQTQGLIAYENGESSTVVFECSPADNSQKSIREIIPLPEGVQEVFFFEASQKSKKSVGIYQSGMTLSSLRGWFAHNLSEGGWRNAKSYIERDKLKNFDTFVHEKRNCFIQYEEKDESTIITIVVES